MAEERKGLADKIRNEVLGEKEKEIRIKVNDAEEVGAILRAVGKEVPTLVRGIVDAIDELMNKFYSPEVVRERAKAIAEAYKTLVEAGIPEDKALELAARQIPDLNLLIEKLSKMI